jgi:hypothetical protein
VCTRAVVSTRGVEARLSRADPFDVALDPTQLGPALADYLRLGGPPWRIASAEGESIYCLLMLRAGEGRHRSHLCWHRTDGSLHSWHERLQVLERDKELLLQSCTTRAPEALDSLGAEEHRTVYSMLGLRVDALPDKSLRVQGAFGEENLVCHHDRTSTR